MKRNKRKVQEGIVEKVSGNKTISVKISTRLRHKMYKKVITINTNVLVHDEENKCKLGDKILIMETRPLSRMKRWRFCEVIN
ncbi:30S ribosomal protein S17 [Candidatus Margulisiibacteriota bacterium]